MRDLKLSFAMPPENKNPWFPSNCNDFVFRWHGRAAEGQTDAQIELVEHLTRCLLTSDPKDEAAKLPNCYEDETMIEFFEDGKPKQDFSVRVLATPAAKQKLFAASIRFPRGKTPAHEIPPPVDTDGFFHILLDTAKVNGADKLKNRNESKYLFSPDAACDVLLNELGLFTLPGLDDTKLEHLSLSFNGTDPRDLQLNEHPSGLVVVSGGTGTGKSTYARGIVLRYLVRLAMLRYARTEPKSRFDPPHLVTFEDPIEDWTLDRLDEDRNIKDSLSLLQNPESDLKAGIRLTCRAKHYDVANLETAYLHALRQKPSVVYIGECREEKDWNLALELGGTGHLVVTTCHASSLIDTFVKLSGTSRGDAQSRQHLASSLLGVVHLHTTTIEKPANGAVQKHFTELNEAQTFPTLWKNTAESISNFVADGLSSLVVDDDNVLSRRKLAETILNLQLKHFDELPATLDEWPPTLSKSVETYKRLLKELAVSAAFELDVYKQ